MSEGPSATAARLGAGERNREATLLVAQIAGSLAILAFLPGGFAKLLALLALWSATFRSVRLNELLWCGGICALFTLMNIMAVRQGVFRFHAPDYLGLPVWEFFMWGFYVLHATRMLKGPVPSGHIRTPLLLGIAFALPFVTLNDPQALLLASGLVLALAFAFFHEPFDWRYAGYLLVLGGAIEYIGVGTGQWSYPGDSLGGVPLWFATMWAGVGLFTRRLFMPLLQGERGA